MKAIFELMRVLILLLNIYSFEDNETRHIDDH